VSFCVVGEVIAGMVIVAFIKYWWFRLLGSRLRGNDGGEMWEWCGDVIETGFIPAKNNALDPRAIALLGSHIILIVVCC